mmetsp:Transcript_1183/g.3655  ORF Transcript_1183/g.3655 Transcript_1183/m.3655 type:complete len:88 (+) Transcript_1183:1045-1308(+)
MQLIEVCLETLCEFNLLRCPAFGRNARRSRELERRAPLSHPTYQACGNSGNRNVWLNRPANRCLNAEIRREMRARAAQIAPRGLQQP